jgi:hypothetical protein
VRRPTTTRRRGTVRPLRELRVHAVGVSSAASRSGVEGFNLRIRECHNVASSVVCPLSFPSRRTLQLNPTRKRSLPAPLLLLRLGMRQIIAQASTLAFPWTSHVPLQPHPPSSAIVVLPTPCARTEQRRGSSVRANNHSHHRCPQCRNRTPYTTTLHRPFPKPG